ncbi:hypothetical protein MHZ93_14755 [Roseomonas sp. ACRSG]|nr:hypothetical protein [Roseomonas sp. ACRSG]
MSGIINFDVRPEALAVTGIWEGSRSSSLPASSKAGAGLGPEVLSD